MTNYTPGPWFYDVDSDNPENISIFGEEEKVADIWRLPNQANLELLAAAPELLKRLKEAQRLLSNAGELWDCRAARGTGEDLRRFLKDLEMKMAIEEDDIAMEGWVDGDE